MWNGKWDKELNDLYESYYSIFGSEPDCGSEIDFDSISYNTFKELIRKSIVLKIPITKLMAGKTALLD